MSRVEPLLDDEMPPESRRLLGEHIAAGHSATNMKRTLSHDPLALRVLLEWYPLRSDVASFLGDRATLLFAHAISTAADCLICSTFFRRILIDAGENPDDLVLNEIERGVVAYGRQLAKNANEVGDEVFAPLQRRYTPAQLVALTSFGAIMLATNVFNNALRIELDQYLWPYRKSEQ